MEKFMKKMWKKSEGFTLVELIVVIAILGILAAVAVPAYSGYLTKAKEASDITALDAIKTAAVAAMAQTGAVEDIVVDTDSGVVNKVTVNTNVVLFGDGASATAQNVKDYATYFGSDAPTLKSDTFKNGAKWDADANDGAWVKK